MVPRYQQALLLLLHSSVRHLASIVCSIRLIDVRMTSSEIRSSREPVLVLDRTNERFVISSHLLLYI